MKEVWLTFGDNNTGKILGKGHVDKISPSIENVHLVEGLKHILLSISQLSDVNNKVLFESCTCLIKDGDTDEVLFCQNMRSNVYVVTMNDFNDSKVVCLSTIDDQISLWNRRAGHLDHKLLKHLEAYHVMKGLPRFSSTKDCSPCGPYLQGKQTHVSHKVKNQVGISGCLELF